jgi:hypothetical protein
MILQITLLKNTFEKVCQNATHHTGTPLFKNDSSNYPFRKRGCPFLKSKKK